MLKHQTRHSWSAQGHIILLRNWADPMKQKKFESWKWHSHKAVTSSVAFSHSHQRRRSCVM
jgi:hypothetical protein